MIPHLSRRQLLHILSVGAGGFAFSRDTTHWGMPAALAASPLSRFVYFNIPHGTLSYEDIVKNGGTETDFELGVMTEPLAKIKQHIVIVDNLELVKTGGGGCTHNIGMVQATTGSRSPADAPASDNRATGPSIDHVLKTKVGSKVTPGCPNLVLSAQGISYSYDDSARRTGAIGNPVDVYNKYLMGLTGNGGNATPNPAVVKRVKTRGYVLDAVSKDLAAFQKTLPAEARERADAQLDILQSLSARVDAATKAPAATCGPKLPAGFNAGSSADFPKVAQLHADMLLSAFACDVTRIGMLGFRGTPHNGPKCDFAPVNRPDLHVHASSHTDIAKDGGKAFRSFKAFCFGVIADFAEKLSQIPEPITGGTMLDNTLIVVGTGIGQYHSQSGLQFVVIGGKNLGVKTGRVLRLGTAREPLKGVRVNKLWVSALNLMGVPADTFNAVADQSNRDVPRSAFEGPLPGLKG